MGTEVPDVIHEVARVAAIAEWNKGSADARQMTLAVRAALDEVGPALIDMGRHAATKAIEAEVERHAKRWLRDPVHPPVIGDVVWQLRQILQGGTDGN